MWFKCVCGNEGIFYQTLFKLKHIHVRLISRDFNLRWIQICSWLNDDSCSSGVKDSNQFKPVKYKKNIRYFNNHISDLSALTSLWFTVFMSDSSSDSKTPQAEAGSGAAAASKEGKNKVMKNKENREQNYRKFVFILYTKLHKLGIWHIDIEFFDTNYFKRICGKM